MAVTDFSVAVTDYILNEDNLGTECVTGDWLWGETLTNSTLIVHSPYAYRTSY